MRRNRMIKSAHDLFSGKRRKTGNLALCVLGTAAALYMVCAWILPAVIADPETRKPIALEQVELSGSYEIETGGFVMAFHVGNSRTEDAGGTNTVHKPAGSLRALSAQPGEPASTQTPQVELHVETVTDGEYYEELVAKLAEDEEELIAPLQVMELTASLGGEKLDLSGLTITMQVDPNRALVEAAVGDGAAAASLGEEDGGTGKQPGMVVTVLPLGGEAVVRTFTSEEMESGEPLPPVDVTYTVPEGVPAMYAVSARAAGIDGIMGDETWSEQRIIETDTTIDLNGHTITCGSPFSCAPDPDNPSNTFDPSLFVVRPGATLTIVDSSEGKTGLITAGSLGSLIQVQDGGTLNIQGGKLEIGSGSASEYRVITAFGNSTVNVFDGTITGGKTWAGGGIYMDSGTVNISGGSITGNTSTWKGGGVYADSGTVNISGGMITANEAASLGGGVYVGNGGTVNISGGTISENKTSHSGGGVYADSGTVNLSGQAIITDNEALYFGGGVYADKVVMKGGDVSKNKVTTGWGQGGGVWAKTTELSGGTISENSALDYGSGGGVYTDLMVMSGGEISGNIARLKGGGVYATGMRMTAGSVSDNKVEGTNAANNGGGGGGIYIAEGAAIFNDGGITEHGIYNMSITGGTISGNISDHVGGGIFVGNKAKVHIRGTSSNVYITNNIARDVNYTYGQTGGHGFAGGGIFVEHPMYEQGADITTGGYLYLYEAEITGNTAQHGGGVAGCGASRIVISHVSGIAVYDNVITGTDSEKFGTKIPASKDLYSDGMGIVDSMMPGGAQVTWVGWKADGPGDNPKLSQVSFDNNVKDYQYGFYLEATNLKQEDKAAAHAAATVFITGNTSNSGGGGIGGNGYMELGFDPPRPKTLVLRKIVQGPDTGSAFQFTIELKNKSGELISFSYAKVDSGGTKGALASHDPEGGPLVIDLRNRESVMIEELPEGTQYTISEVPASASGYAPFIEIDGEAGGSDGTASGTVSSITGSTVIFTNKSSYELPSTGGIPTVLYIGGALLIAVIAGLLIYKKRVGRRNDCQ